MQTRLCRSDCGIIRKAIGEMSWLMSSRKRKRCCGRSVKGEIGETNSLITKWKTSKKGSLALRSVLGERGDGWRTVRVMG